MAAVAPSPEQVAKMLKAQEDIARALALWRSGKTTNESTLLIIDLAMREAK